MRTTRYCPRKNAAFTLVEVILAVAIATGLLLVALYFYNQVSNLRNQVLQESEEIGTSRLLLEKITSELRACRPHDWYGFFGSSNSIQFVTVGFQESMPGTNRQTQAGADLLMVTYSLVISEQQTNSVVAGLTREEKRLDRKQEVTLLNSSSNAPSAKVSTNLTFRADDVPATNQVEVLTENVRHLQFRYWSGSAWLESWDELFPPRAVEIELSPRADTATEEEAVPNLYRRVIFIPCGKAEPSDFELDMMSESDTETRPDAVAQKQ